jgi:hypothetical protein
MNKDASHDSHESSYARDYWFSEMSLHWISGKMSRKLSNTKIQNSNKLRWIRWWCAITRLLSEYQSLNDDVAVKQLISMDTNVSGVLASSHQVWSLRPRIAYLRERERDVLFSNIFLDMRKTSSIMPLIIITMMTKYKRHVNT